MKNNSGSKIRKDCRDVFNAFMVKNAKFEGKEEIPICLSTMTKFPTKIITFEEAVATLKKEQPDFNATVCFSKDDYKFDSLKGGVWSNPFKWLKILSNFEAVVQPDFSTCLDFPRAQKVWNTYRMRAVGCFLVDNGLAVLNNYRSGDEDSFEYCTDGIPENSLVFISTHGCIKDKENRARLILGIKHLLTRKRPSGIAIYGRVPQDISDILNEQSIPFQSYETDLDRRLRGKNE